jgi:restriction system protein
MEEGRARAQVPTAKGLMWPTLQAIRSMGGSGTIQEIAEKVMEIAKFPEAQQNILHGEGPQTEIEYRLAWARTNSNVWRSV